MKRIAAIIFALALGVVFFMTGCGSNEPEENKTINCVPTEQAKAAQPVSGVNLAAVKGIAAVADENGFSIIDEKTGKETQIDGEPARSVAFDGNTAYYVRTGIADESVKIRYDDDTMVDPDSKAVWLRGEIYRYNSESGKSEKLFTTNEEHASLVYFDSENLYYLDFSDKNVGYYYGMSKHIALSLYEYNLKSGERTVISEYAVKPFGVEGYIAYVNSDLNISAHPNYVNPGELHIFDTSSGKETVIDDNAEFLYAENGKFVFAHLTQDSQDNITGGEIKSCNADGTQVESIDRFGEGLESRYDGYLTFFNEDGGMKFYNSMKNKYVVINNYDKYNIQIVDNEIYGVEQDDNENPDYKKIYKFNDDGQPELVADYNEVIGMEKLAWIEKVTTDGIFFGKYFADYQTNIVYFAMHNN